MACKGIRGDQIGSLDIRRWWWAAAQPNTQVGTEIVRKKKAL